MPNPSTKTLPSTSLVQRLMQAAAPGGALTRRPIFLGLAAGLIVVIGGLGMIAHWRSRAEDPAAMRFADKEISRLPTRSHVTSSASLGRGEVREYGMLDDKQMDATVMMVVPPPGQMGFRDFFQELRELDLVRNATRATMARSYELHTRFGIYQAAEIQVDMVGRGKECLAFLSRFETAAVYLKGWYCDAVGTKPSPERLACALDGMVVDRPLEAANADAFMRERMTKPSFCTAVARSQDRELRPIPPASTNRMR
jgi:hypothetical protein